MTLKGGGPQVEGAEGPSFKRTRSYIQESRGDPPGEEEPDCPDTKATAQHLFSNSPGGRTTAGSDTGSWASNAIGRKSKP